LENEGTIVGLRIRLPDNGDRPSVALIATFSVAGSVGTCPYAVYRFDEPPRLSAEDLAEINSGMASEESAHGGRLVWSGWIGDDEVEEWEGLTQPGVDRNPFDAYFVAVVCPETKGIPTASFHVETRCVQGDDGFLKAGASIESVDVDL
jgi:hypothetical protein